MILSTTLILTILSSSDQAALGEEIVRYARSRLGEKVGGGQCAELVFEALHAAGADTFGRSRPRTSLDEAQPGDILDFRGVEFRGRVNRRRTYWYRFEEHMAIVARVRPTEAGLLVTVLHQNVGLAKESAERRERVTEQTLNLSDVKEGELRAYQPRRLLSTSLHSLRAPDDADDRP